MSWNRYLQAYRALYPDADEEEIRQGYHGLDKPVELGAGEELKNALMRGYSENIAANTGRFLHFLGFEDSGDRVTEYWEDVASKYPKSEKSFVSISLMIPQFLCSL